MPSPPPPTPSLSERSRLEAASRLPEWKTWLPLGFIVLALVILLVVPPVLFRRILPHRERLARATQPALILAAHVEHALAREMAALRGYLLTGDPSFLRQYRAALAEERSIRMRLADLADRLGPEVVRHLARLGVLAERWRAGHAEVLAGRLSAAEVRERVPIRQAQYEAALNAAVRLQDAIREVMEADLEVILGVERSARRLEVLLAVLALAAAVVVVRLGIGLRRRAGEEQALRRAALVLTEAMDVGEACRRIVESAVRVGRGESGWLERVDWQRGEVEVVAVVGRRAPPRGARMSYAGSMSEVVVRRRGAEVVGRLAEERPEVAARLPGPGKDQGALVVPLGEDRRPFGSLIIVRSGRRMFRPEETVPPRILGALGSLALRRILLLEEARRGREQAERLAGELRRATERRTRLIRGLSHDLKNPLGAALGHCDLMVAGVHGELTEAQEESVRRVRASIRTALDLINDLVDLARAEAGQLRIEREPVDIPALVREMAEDHRPSAREAGLAMDVRPDGPLPRVRTDPARVRQILGNLLSNAVKYTEEGGVTVEVAEVDDGADAPGPGRWITISVVDTGPGIPPERQEEIFREFSRLQPGAKRGAGLGLAISRRLARLLGGDVTVRSEVGAGATFTLWVPVAGPRPGRPGSRG